MVGGGGEPGNAQKSADFRVPRPPPSSRAQGGPGKGPRHRVFAPLMRAEDEGGEDEAQEEEAAERTEAAPPPPPKPKALSPLAMAAAEMLEEEEERVRRPARAPACARSPASPALLTAGAAAAGSARR